MQNARFSKTTDARSAGQSCPRNTQEVNALPPAAMKQVEGGTVNPASQFPRNDQKWNNYLFYGFYQGVDWNAAG